MDEALGIQKWQRETKDFRKEVMEPAVQRSYRQSSRDPILTFLTPFFRYGIKQKSSFDNAGSGQGGGTNESSDPSCSITCNDGGASCSCLHDQPSCVCM